MSGEDGFDDEQWVAADAEVTIGDKADLPGAQLNPSILPHAIEHGEVVAETVHLHEAEPARGVTPFLNAPAEGWRRVTRHDDRNARAGRQ